MHSKGRIRKEDSCESTASSRSLECVKVKKDTCPESCPLLHHVIVLVMSFMDVRHLDVQRLFPCPFLPFLVLPAATVIATVVCLSR